MLNTIDPTSTNAWQKLAGYYNRFKGQSVRKLFEEDSQRAATFSIETPFGIFDFAKNSISGELLHLMDDLFSEMKLDQAIDDQFNGQKINQTENRAVLHTALRNRSGKPVVTDGRDVMPDILEVLQRMERFTDSVRSGNWKGFTGKRIKSVVNIGIGGSDLGPKMACEALRPFGHPELDVHFVSNVDGNDLRDNLKNLDPEETLFIIVSKTFTTQETMTNAQSARELVFEVRLMLKTFQGTSLQSPPTRKK